MNLDKSCLKSLSQSSVYICINIDVVGSEKYENTKIIYNALVKIVELLNEKYKKNVVIPFQIRRGDEILGVISSFVNCFEVYRDVRHIALKCKINLYFGVGFGTLDTKRIMDINCINGSAVINACRAVDNYLKNNSEEMIFNYCQKNQPVKFFALGGENIPYEAINALVYTIYNELIDSEQQRELIQLIELHPEMTYEEIGVNLGYTINNAKSNVSTILARSKYKEYVQMQKALLKFLQKLQKIMNACM